MLTPLRYSLEIDMVVVRKGQQCIVFPLNFQLYLYVCVHGIFFFIIDSWTLESLRLMDILYLVLSSCLLQCDPFVHFVILSFYDGLVFHFQCVWQEGIKIAILCMHQHWRRCKIQIL